MEGILTYPLERKTDMNQTETNAALPMRDEPGRIEPVAELTDVRLIYHEPQGETLAVEGLTMRVERGELLSVVGPSGCGKTSVLSLISGLYAPSSGNVRVLGGSPARAAGRIGYMLQQDQLLEWRTIEKNVLLGLEIKRMLTPETRAYAMELLEKYGLAGFARSAPERLSGGMRQRAALVRTLAFRPELLLLDEPFSALDYQTRLILEDEVRSIIKTGGYTAVLVTHDISEAIAMGDRVLVFSGRPARVRREFTVDIEGAALARRGSPRFRTLFDAIWKELR